MVKIDFPYYPGYSVVEIPDDNFMGVFDLPAGFCENTESAIIKKAQSSPIGCPALAEMLPIISGQKKETGKQNA